MREVGCVMKFKFYIKKYIWVILAALAFAGTLYFENKVLIISFEQLLFGLFKIKGGGASTVSYGVMYVIVAFLIICPILLLPVLDFGKKFVIKIKNKIIQIYPIKRVETYGFVLLIVGIVLLFYVFQFFPYVKNTLFSSTKLFDEYYIDSSNVDITFNDYKRNLIYIMVESFETSNVSTQNGGLFDESIVPNLEQIAIDNINFSNNDKIGGAYFSFGTNWTSGAMIAQTAGVPIKVTLDDLGVNSLRFSNIKNIGDILNDNGYNNYLLLGSDADFGGRRAYFANHNYLIKDYVSAKEEGFIEEDYYEWWGYEDSKLFDYAKMMLEDISQDDKPFNFTMLTADTHFTDGYLDKSCVEKFEDAYANSFYCSDDMINDFVEWIKKQKFYDNTTIIIVGDHLTMQDGFYGTEYDFSNRTIYNVFINSVNDNSFNNKNRIFTVMDLFPTTLASIGADIEGDRLGLGTNLFSDKKTIPEIIGLDKFNSELSKGSHYYYNYIRK